MLKILSLLTAAAIGTFGFCATAQSQGAAAPNLAGNYRCQPQPDKCDLWGTAVSITQEGNKLSINNEKGSFTVVLRRRPQMSPQRLSSPGFFLYSLMSSIRFSIPKSVSDEYWTLGGTGGSPAAPPPIAGSSNRRLCRLAHAAA